MAVVTFQESELEIAEDQSVLEALLAAGYEIPNRCRSGVCQSCVLQATSGAPPMSAQSGLKDTLKVQNFFLSCQCYPKKDLTVAFRESILRTYKARVVSKANLASNILGLTLRVEKGFHYHPGQYVNFIRDDGLTRCYSLASHQPYTQLLDFHIELFDDGQMSSWIANELQLEDSITLQGPMGDCFYVPDKTMHSSILLIGHGSGLAPLLGIVEDALSQQHQGELHLFHGVKTQECLYLCEHLNALAAEHAQFYYYPCVISSSAAATDCALKHVPDLTQWKVYLCGSPDMVKASKRQVYLAGAALPDIYTDEFVCWEQI